jgi:hypothetical protein
MKTTKSLFIIALWSISLHVSAQVSSWLLGGNNLPTSTIGVLGASSNNPIEIRTNNLLRMYIEGDTIATRGFIGVNTNVPRQMFHVVGGNILISRTAARSDKALGSTNGSILFGDETSTAYPYGSWGIEYVNDSTQGHGLNMWKTWDQNGGGLNNVIFLCEEKDYKGYVGIGTNHPKQKLHVVDGNILISRSSSITSAPGSACGSMMFGDVVGDGHPMSKWAIGYYCNESGNGGLNFWKPKNNSGEDPLNYVMFIDDRDGNVGIGTHHPLYKLSVNGTVLAKEIRVNEDPSYWPDFVFDKDFKLMSLAEVRQFVSDNKHLPDVPSAADIDGKDVSLGEMNRILLQKIEELTLYVIDLQEQIDALKEAAGKE